MPAAAEKSSNNKNAHRDCPTRQHKHERGNHVGHLPKPISLGTRLWTVLSAFDKENRYTGTNNRDASDHIVKDRQ